MVFWIKIALIFDIEEECVNQTGRRQCKIFQKAGNKTSLKLNAKY